MGINAEKTDIHIIRNYDTGIETIEREDTVVGAGTYKLLTNRTGKVEVVATGEAVNMKCRVVVSRSRLIPRQ